MNKRRIIVILLILSAFGMSMSAQNASDKIKPQWLHKLPTPGNGTFKYQIISASAKSLDEARNKCLAELVTSTGMKSGVIAVSKDNISEFESQNWNNGKLNETVSYDRHTETSLQHDEVRFHVANVAEYWKRDAHGNYYLTTLYAKSEPSCTPHFDNIEISSRYGFGVLLRSATVPGWGQLHKGAYAKGSVIMASTAAAVSGIIFTESQRSDYIGKIQRTHDSHLIQAYKTKADHFAAGRNICIGAAAALYVYNIIDAIATPGAKRIIVKDNVNYSMVPLTMPDGKIAFGTSLTYKF